MLHFACTKRARVHTQLNKAEKAVQIIWRLHPHVSLDDLGNEEEDDEGDVAAARPNAGGMACVGILSTGIPFDLNMWKKDMRKVRRGSRLHVGEALSNIDSTADGPCKALRMDPRFSALPFTDICALMSRRDS
jgi:hypothetical protein